MSMLCFAGWLVCVVYSTIPSFWLMIHPRAERWRQSSRSPYRILLPLWIGAWIVAVVATAYWRRAAFYSAAWPWIPAALLIGAGLVLYRLAGAGFSFRQLVGLPEVSPAELEQRLVTTGIRARVRHPVYLGHLCEMLGWSLGTGLAVCWVLTLFAVLTGAAMIRMEDAELERRFGDRFRDYRGRVPAVFPRFGE
jgi:protein-S-isoprenylcysteine O-methyltransferase Ste14